jgi:hypothetical protein
MCSSEVAGRGAGQATTPAPFPSSHWTGTRDILITRAPNVNHIQKKFKSLDEYIYQCSTARPHNRPESMSPQSGWFDEPSRERAFGPISKLPFAL